MLLLVLHVIVLVVLIVVNMLACVPTTLRPLMSTKLLEFCYKSEIWASLSWYVMVKWGDWGCRPNPYSSHIHVIYIKGVWQPLYAVDVHMYVSPPPYGRSCRPSFWNFATNLKSGQVSIWIALTASIKVSYTMLTSMSHSEVGSSSLPSSIAFISSLLKKLIILKR